MPLRSKKQRGNVLRLINWTREAAKRPVLPYVLCGGILTINILVNLLWLGSSRDGLKDLGSFLHSGAAYREGLNPYAYHEGLNPQPLSEDTLNLNPPVSVYFFEFLTYLDISLVQALFVVGSLVMIAGAVIALLIAYPERRNLLVILAVISMAGMWHLFWYIQLYAPLIVAIVASWLLIKRGNLIAAGMLIGFVIAIKPNYALVPLLFLAAGHYKVAFPAVATAGFISFIPIVIDGPEIYLQWLTFTMDFEGMTWSSNSSLMSVGARLGFPVAGKALGMLLLGVMLYWQWRWRPPVLDSMAAALMTVVLFGPVSWAGYTLFLLPFLFSRTWDRPMWVAVLMLDVPFSAQGAGESLGSQIVAFGVPLPELAMSISTTFRMIDLPVSLPALAVHLQPIANATFGSIYAWAVLLLLVRLMRERPAGAQVPWPSESDTSVSKAPRRTPSRWSAPNEELETSPI